MFTRDHPLNGAPSGVQQLARLVRYCDSSQLLVPMPYIVAAFDGHLSYHRLYARLNSAGRGGYVREKIGTTTYFEPRDVLREFAMEFEHWGVDAA